MFSGEYIFSQVMDHLPIHTFRKCVERYSGNRYVKSFNCFDQFLCMAFGQLTHRESLRDIDISVVTLLSVVPLKIGNNNCKPGETYRETPSICKIPTLYRAHFAEDRHQHSRG